MGAYHYFRLDNFEADRFVTSNLVAPRTLFFIRLILALYSLAVLAVMFVANQERFFNYMTCWSFFGLTIYLCLATYLSGRYSFGIHRYTPEANPLVTASVATQAACWFLYETFATYHLLVPVVYWSVLYSSFADQPLIQILASIGPHATDFGILVIEVLFNRQQMQLSHWCIPIIVLAFYLGLAYLVWGVQQIFIYPFLNFNKLHGWVALIIAGIALGTLIIFTVMYFVHRVRDYLLRRRRAIVVIREKTDDQYIDAEPATMLPYHPHNSAPHPCATHIV
ncbi:hypothetical protein IWQ60_009864 [Tieghemiomyces parasiticus]|uniref:Uncharacterized protein n=1 Tax=Tieghemiomyces parasiticus TaxID=78921 RepID=A0A9W7ZRY7_9FUNG|nr:hypothetical protein IWQ60_009864 [Tieghemiomyces parasiticus]